MSGFVPETRFGLIDEAANDVVARSGLIDEWHVEVPQSVVEKRCAIPAGGIELCRSGCPKFALDRFLDKLLFPVYLVLDPVLHVFGLRIGLPSRERPAKRPKFPETNLMKRP
jgi:hypothetical protein